MLFGRLYEKAKVMNLSHLVPAHKSDLETADAAISAGYPAVEPVLTELLEWLKDFNWPVARRLQPILASIGLPLVQPIDRAFASNDETWQYWIIVCLLSENQDLRKHYQSVLSEIANHPTDLQRQHELDRVAKNALI